MVVAYGRSSNTLNYYTYLQKRAARILPLYYFALLLTLFYFFLRIGLFKVQSNYIPTLTDIILNIFLIQAWIFGKATTINTAAWSLSSEAFFYVVFPLLFNKVYTKISLLTTFIFVFIFFLLSQVGFYFFIYQFPNLTNFFIYNPLFHFNEFLVGNFIGFLFLQRKSNIKNAFIYFFLFLVISVVYIYKPLAKINLHNGIYMIFFSPIVFFLAVDQGKLSRILRMRPFRYLGEISYGVYILQFPIYFFFTASLTFLGFKINSMLFYVYVLILLMFSGFSFHLVEKPLRKKLKN